MNNQIPYFMNPQDNINNQIPNQKNLRILENRITKLESNSNNNLFNDDPTDMYII